MDIEQTQRKENVYVTMNTVLFNRGINRENSERIDEESAPREESEVQVEAAPSLYGSRWRILRITMMAGLISFLVIAVVVISSVLVTLLIKSAQRERSSELLLKSCKRDLAKSVKMLSQDSLKSPNCTSWRNASNTTEAITPSNPAASCRQLPKFSPSGYYWLLATNGSSFRKYCDMERMCKGVSGGWMRAVSLNMKQGSSKCPSHLCLNSASPRTCRRCPSAGRVLSETYSVGVPYSRVCGRVRAYQIGMPSSYSGDLSGYIHLTYGSQKEHIWAFVAALQNVPLKFGITACPCMNPAGSFARNYFTFKQFGGNYFCDATPLYNARLGMFNKSDPLWNGSGCGATNKCCSFNNPPWFYRELSETTGSDIKMTLKLNGSPAEEDFAIEIIDIYVQ